MFVTTSDGVRLNVVDEGEGRPVVLLAGYSMGVGGWTLQREHLRARHRVVSIDRRNHGDSDTPSFGQRMSRHGKDLHDALVALDLDDALVVGSSMGSNTILAYVDLFGTERLRGVVLVDQTPKMINEGDWDLGMVGLTRASLDEFVATFPGTLNPLHATPRPRRCRC